jgi:hypothetical protein
VTLGTHKRGKPRRGWRRAFLASLAESCNVRASAARAGVGRRTAYRHRVADPVFAEAWADATEAACDLMEEEARRRAVEGVVRPVFHDGKQVGTVRERSDVLLIFLLKANRPEKYRDAFGAARGKTGDLNIIPIVTYADLAT